MHGPKPQMLRKTAIQGALLFQSHPSSRKTCQSMRPDQTPCKYEEQQNIARSLADLQCLQTSSTQIASAIFMTFFLVDLVLISPRTLLCEPMRTPPKLKLRGPRIHARKRRFATRRDDPCSPLYIQALSINRPLSEEQFAHCRQLRNDGQANTARLGMILHSCLEHVTLREST